MASPVRVWLNRTYAENVFFMDQLRRNPADRAVEIHATHGDPDSPVLAAADTAELEPEGLSPAGYVEYALDQCARRAIDVFVPRLHQSALVAHRAEFEAAGTALLAPPPEAVALFEDKVIAYEAVRAIGVPVPPWWRVRTADELVLAVEELEAGGHRACFKPASGAGGVGFRMVTRDPFSLTHLNGFPSPSVPLPLVVEALRAAEEPVDWLVMPRLEQPEVSVDCLTGPDNRVRLAGGPHQERPPPRVHPARAVAGTGAADRRGLRTAPPVQHPVPDVRRPARPDGRQHPPGRRAAPAGAVRDQRAVGGGPAGTRRRPG
ncbi:hypothetical protein SVIOM342S_01175 [Streptomyces violaceorubidus]